jgi:large subunit ribosomal protein L30
VAEKTLKMIRIKWVRSGIGFTHHQKTIVRSLGLNKLNHTVVRPDTPQIRGIVAAVPHLLEIVPEPQAPAWASKPEYAIIALAATPTEPAQATTVVTQEIVGESSVAQPEASEVKSADAGQEKAPPPEGSEPAHASEE